MFTVAIVGRPNVGKSSLFNAMLGYRRTIVLDMPGTTMDFIAEKVKWSKEPLELVDSQGIFSEDDLKVLETVLKKANAVMFVVDAKVGITPFDLWIARHVQKTEKPTLLVVNKCDGKSNASLEFSELGFDEMTETSAAHRTNIEFLKEWSLRGEKPVEKTKEESAAEQPLMLALVGRPNTGKSTLMNRLCQDEISRVSPIAHTTRDPIAHEIVTDEGVVRLVDTAGIRRPRSEKEDVELFSVQASTRAIKQADVVFLLIACHEAITDQDMRLLNLVEREGKPAVVLLNFWDTLDAKQRKAFLNDSDFAGYLKNFKSLPLSGKEGMNVERLLPMALRMRKKTAKRVKTSMLNDVVDKIVRRNPPPTMGTRNFNILYASQVKASPPTFVFFLNRKGNLPDSYRSYLENKLRESLGFKGQPVRIYFRGSEKNEGRERRHYHKFQNR